MKDFNIRSKVLNKLDLPIYLQPWWLKEILISQYKCIALRNTRRKNTSKNYSCKPFDERKAIFVHIPKCGGVSINKTIFNNLAGGHTTFKEYLKIFDSNCIANYFKFTVVRNPWDRLVSAYFFLQQGGLNEVDRTWFNKELSTISSFNDFVKNWLNKKNIWKYRHFKPQYHYILDNKKKMQLDFIGFIENIDEDFAYVVQRIGVNCTLPKLNKSEHSFYMEYYNDETIDIVAKVYAEDIKLLGYSFDNSSLSRQLTDRLTR